MKKEEQKEVIAAGTKQKATLKIVGLVILFAFPLVYLYYRTNNKPPVVEAPQANATQQTANDIPTLENLVQTNPTYDNLINLSMAYINNQMPGKSVDHLKRAIELNPNSSIAYNNLGVAYTMLNQYQNGVDACTKALQIDTSFQLAKNNLRWATDEKNKVLESIKTEENVAANKRDINFYMDYGMNYFKISDYTKSIEIWNKVIDMDPKNTAALNSIGTAFMLKNQIDDAVILFKKAIELEPTNQLAKNNLAWAMDEKSKAEASLKK